MRLKAGVIGYPVNHSLSPVIHRYWITQYGIDASYEAIPVEPDRLEEFLHLMPEKGYIGLNVTLPHKEKAASIIQKAGGTVHFEAIGAINTVIVNNRKLEATNTDYYGFMKLIDYSRHYEKVLVIGSGGAARAICKALLDAKNYGEHLCREIILANRTVEKAEKLASDMNDIRLKVIHWADREKVLHNVSLLVNTTSLGMTGQHRLEISLQNLPLSATVIDIVYNPLETELLKNARERGNKTVDGLGMLLYQAQAAFDAWFHIMPEVNEALRNLVLQKLH